MSTKDPEFLIYARNMFARHGGNYDLLNNKFHAIHTDPEKRDSLAVYSHFYYYICAPNEPTVREELKIVGITSLIEAMMSDIEHKDPFQYFESEYSGKNSIDDVGKFKEEYLSKYGANKKIVRFFRNFISKEDVEDLLKGIVRPDMTSDDGDKPLRGLDQLARFLYQMRSDFVHRADMQGMCPSYAIGTLGIVGGKAYTITATMDSILEMFEKGFVTFWQSKASV